MSLAVHSSFQLFIILKTLGSIWREGWRTHAPAQSENAATLSLYYQQPRQLRGMFLLLGYRRWRVNDYPEGLPSPQARVKAAREGRTPLGVQQRSVPLSKCAVVA